MKDVYIIDYQGFDIFSYPLALNEKTFLNCAFDKPDNSDSDELALLIFQCEWKNININLYKN